MNDQLMTENVMLKSKIELLEKEVDRLQDKVILYKTRNHVLIDILKKVDTKEVVKIESPNS